MDTKTIFPSITLGIAFPWRSRFELFEVFVLLSAVTIRESKIKTEQSKSHRENGKCKAEYFLTL